MKISRKESLNNYIINNNLPLDIKWLDRATTHKSSIQGSNIEYHNEKLEAIGDSVLDLLVIDWLYDNFTTGTEGEYTILRSEIVSNKNLAKIGKELQLSKILRTGKGTSITDKLIADCLEAIFGALFKQNTEKPENSYQLLKKIFEDKFSSVLSDLKERNFQIELRSYNQYNPKNQLQEFIAKHQLNTPEKQLVKEEGPDHDKTFTTEYFIRLKTGNERKNLKSSGTGKNKKESEMRAAKKLLALLIKEKLHN